MNNEIMSKKKKGFTLVEIIVVLVILAVLAAVTIPSMLGFVEEAKGKTEIANARAAYLAAQMIATETYANDGVKSELTVDATKIKAKIGTDMPDAKVVAKSTAGIVTEVVFTNNKYVVTMANLGGGDANGTVTVAPETT